MFQFGLKSASLPNGITESTIVVMGNPAVWWVGFAAVIALTVFYVPKIFSKRFNLKNNLPAIFIIVFFFFQWLPYVLISRVVFIYHFYSNVPFLCLGSSVFNKQVLEQQMGKNVSNSLLCTCNSIIRSFLPSYFRRAHINLNC